MPDEHSLFSASGASGWMVCHGKILMEQGRRTSSQYADEGTAAHELASRVLAVRVKGGNLTAKAFLGEKIAVENGGKPRVFTVDSEMAEHVDTYVDQFMLMSNPKGSVRLIEQRVHYHTWLNVPKSEAFGTGDGVAIVYDQDEVEWPLDSGNWFPAGDELQLHDLKYGAGVRVDAEGNVQLRLYGLGALHDFDELADNITRVRLVIHQPRKDHLDEELITVEQLKAWSLKAREAAALVKAVQVDSQGLPLAEHLKPDPKACRFCDAKAICPALKAEVREVVSGGKAVADDFSDLTVDPPEEVRSYGGNYLSTAADKLELITQWASAVKAERDRRVLNGTGLPGWKAVAGPKGDRKFAEPGAVELHLSKRPTVAPVMFARKLLSPAQAEKALKKAHPEAWAELQPFITRADGAPTVVPATDPRPEYVRVAANDFEDLSEQPVAEGAAAGTNSHPFR